MHLVEDEVEDEGGEVEHPSRPKHPPRVSCRDEAELSDIQALGCQLWIIITMIFKGAHSS